MTKILCALYVENSRKNFYELEFIIKIFFIFLLKLQKDIIKNKMSGDSCLLLKR